MAPVQQAQQILAAAVVVLVLTIQPLLGGLEVLVL
jgi:hypothetical protein